MKYRWISAGNAVAAALLMSATCMVGSTLAADTAEPAEKNPLQFYTGSDNSFLKATIQVEMAVFDQSDSWFGKAKENLGDNSDSWFESLIRPGLEGSFFLPNSQELYGLVDAVQANTGSGVDAGGSNADLGDVSDLQLINAYAGWRSGNLFSGLGENFLDISFGRQQYKVGDGFLIYSEGGAGGEAGILADAGADQFGDPGGRSDAAQIVGDVQIGLVKRQRFNQVGIFAENSVNFL